MLRYFGLDLLMLIALFASLEAGRALGLRHERKIGKSHGGVGAIDGAIYGLMGLLIAFTFSGAASRFDARRELIVRESNAIGTAYLRLDLLPASVQPQLRADFKSYVDVRLAFYSDLSNNPGAAAQDVARTRELQDAIWSGAVAGSTSGIDPPLRSLLLSSLNDMIDITSVRGLALETHPPVTIYYVLVLLVLISSALAGYEMASNPTRSWFHQVAYCIVLAIVLYITIDLEYPRFGFIRVDATDHFLVDVRNGMK
jgi:hypothetical protein